VHLKSIQARRASTSVQKRFEVRKRSWGVFLGLKVHKRSFLGVLRVCYEGLRSMMLQSVVLRL
jgi:hypothetical protein